MGTKSQHLNQYRLFPFRKYHNSAFSIIKVISTFFTAYRSINDSCREARQLIIFFRYSYGHLFRVDARTVCQSFQLLPTQAQQVAAQLGARSPVLPHLPPKA